MGRSRRRWYVGYGVGQYREVVVIERWGRKKDDLAKIMFLAEEATCPECHGTGVVVEGGAPILVRNRDLLREVPETPT